MAKEVRIGKLSVLARFMDFIMVPIMFLLGGLQPDSIQETHPWHIQRVDPALINTKMATPMIPGDDTKSVQRHFAFLFHAPILGGWKKYTVYKIDYPGSFHVGWIGSEAEFKGEKGFINKLPIQGNEIRLLNGSPKYHKSVFAVSVKGEQIPIRAVRTGQLGTNIDSGIRLF